MHASISSSLVCQCPTCGHALIPVPDRGVLRHPDVHTYRLATRNGYRRKQAYQIHCPDAGKNFMVPAAMPMQCDLMELVAA